MKCQFSRSAKLFCWTSFSLISFGLSACSAQTAATTSTPSTDPVVSSVISTPEAAVNFGVPVAQLYALPRITDYLQQPYRPDFQIPNDVGVKSTEFHTTIFNQSNVANAYAIANSNLVAKNLTIPLTKQATDQKWTLVNAYPVPGNVAVVIEVETKTQTKTNYVWFLNQFDQHGHLLSSPNTRTHPTVTSFLQWEQLHRVLTNDQRQFNLLQPELFAAIKTVNLSDPDAASWIQTYQTKLTTLLNWYLLRFSTTADDQNVHRLTLTHNPATDQSDRGIISFDVNVLNINQQPIWSSAKWLIRANGFAHSNPNFNLSIEQVAQTTN
ncbi:hypothetical protein J2Z62_000745 [Mycoplasmoides fastidiosum]|uniref:Lipoprotein n=1 Tax=Mycoplasmoides fastidiosum TaxID=92758 RepID=A0ABU0M036_9BACT|nr:hypothetical protein [Mycoplasmoides fastidiosum]MDQ0514307.1 hypothetical protein [Mycoplasmoides fastidiosum]UUD38089.1 hypothetical protein NPA10_01725 [Mycoplasmoides fastidiosum]